MTVLHICNDFSHTKVHKNLYRNLDSLRLQQIIYTPLRVLSHKGNNEFEFKVIGSEIIYSNLLHKYHRLFFKQKIRFLKSDIIKKVDFTKISIINATTLFSDGALAFHLHQKFNIPFTVTVRNSDISTFLKYRPDLSFLAYKVLGAASKVIFISEANKKAFLNHHFIKRKTNTFLKKSMVINNGISDFWIDNRIYNKNRNSYNFLFIGRFDKNKNATKLIEAFKKLELEFPETKLNLVGGNGSEHEKVMKRIKDDQNINYLGYIANKEQLREIYSENDCFILTSYNETFGLVYVESLSQGLPIIYSKDQGIDGTFNTNVGIAVNPSSTAEIYEAMLSFINNELDNSFSSINFENFRWSKIALKYKNIFKEAI